MPKNTEKRNDILATTYKLVAKKGYRDVYLRDIADKENISKSLIQRYFGKKENIIEYILHDLLETSFHFLGDILPVSKDPNLAVCVYTNLFFRLTDYDENFRNFMFAISSETVLIQQLIEITTSWMDNILSDTTKKAPLELLRNALMFSISGAMQLYNNGASSSDIGRFTVISFFSISNSEEDIPKLLEKNQKVLADVEISRFFEYCVREISWMNNELTASV